MSAAVWGFIGVVVGALLTSVGEWYFLRRREKRSFRAARRLVLDELQTVCMHLSMVEQTTMSAWPNVPGFLPTTDWEANRQILAEEIEDDQWEMLSTVMYNASRLRIMYTRFDKPTMLPKPELDHARDALSDGIAVYKVMTSKEPYLGDAAVQG